MSRNDSDRGCNVIIEQLRVSRLKIPLTQPYKLALGNVAAFDTVLVEIVIAGRSGLGEATILNGYTDETIEGSWELAKTLTGKLCGLSQDAACQWIEAEIRRTAPFTATAFQTAIEMAMVHPLLAIDKSIAVPLLYGINSTDHAGIEREVEAALAVGYRTMKIKVGFDLEADVARVGLIQRVNRGRAKLRIDANQGYSRDDGCAFARRIAPDSVELLEQPCRADDWDAARAVVATSDVPVMLDESIYDLADIDRAAAIGAGFVKLKLMKCGSLGALARGLERIRQFGMVPVLGNGVASDIGCWMEACVASTMIDNAGEMNGFLRQRRGVVRNPIGVEAGSMQLQAGTIPQLDQDRLRETMIDQITAHR
jgi:L-alanine-DL-glutamate epimerase-like enolase superfamily enzyme